MLALLLALCATPVAEAAEVQLSWSGRVLDATGEPITGGVTAELRLYRAPTGGTAVYSEELPLQVTDGQAATVLGAEGGLDSGLFESSLPLYVAVAIAEGETFEELGPRSPVTYAPYAAAAASVQLGLTETCDASSRGVFHAADGVLRLCDGSDWLFIDTVRAGDGLTAESAAASCEQLHAYFPDSPTGTYWLSTEAGPAYQAYCEMDQRGGGWTLVLKANNGDTVNFYSNHEVLDSTGTINASTERDATTGDYLGEAYSRVVGSEMLLRDCVDGDDLYGEFPTNATLLSTVLASHGPVDTTWRCGMLATNLQMSGTALGGGVITHLGLSCEDESESTWEPSDDATVITWRDRAGFDTNNLNHTVGIAKVGSDGGDDVTNGANAATAACVQVFWR